jgi:hypothetical protein
MDVEKPHAVDEFTAWVAWSMKNNAPIVTEILLRAEYTLPRLKRDPARN